MPKTEIDYSNTIIYKITCKDLNVTDVYVGHTTNFVQRKHAHKQSCINDKSPNYKCKLYEVIRNNGGWVNWKMEIINFFECHDHYEARKKEQEYFISLNATLNSIEPMPKPKPKEIVIKPNVIKETFFCEKCNIYCSSLNVLEKHNETNKHKKMNPIKIMENTESRSKFICELCDYTTSNKKDWKKHIDTIKHQSLLNPTQKIPKDYTCICGKIYKHSSSLYAHKKVCNNLKPDILPENVVVDSSNNEIKILTNLVFELVKSNTDLQKQMMEVCKKIQPSNNNSKT